MAWEVVDRSTQCPKNDFERIIMHDKPYVSVTGGLIYVQVYTHPNLTFIVGVLGKYLSNLGMDHWTTVKCVMHYLKRTKDYMLTYRRSESSEIIGFSDSDFVGCQDSKLSTSGYIFMLVGGVVSWKSAKQNFPTSSAMAIDFVDCYEASNHVIWLRNFVTRLHVVDGIKKH